MTREQAIEEINNAFEPAFANYIITALTKSTTVSDNALEQQLCEDVVSRQAVVDMTGLSEWFDSSDSYNEFVIALSKLPLVTPTQRWIPCSERLPKPGEYVDDIVAKYYLVQNEYGDMLVARYSHSGYWKQIYQLQPIDDEIVAWMPLPEPYKAEMESE